MSPADKRIRQVAIVLQSLDASTAKGLLAQLPSDLGKAVRQTMTKLGSISSKERSDAFDSLEGLLSRLSLPNDLSSPAAALLASNEGTMDRVELSEAVTKAPESHVPNHAETPWLSWEPSSLASFLANERPTVIATVLNQLSPERAKVLLDHLPIRIAGATLAAIPHLVLADPSILNEILTEIDRKLPRTQPIPTAITVAGIARLESIINQFGPTQRQAWLESIAEENPEVATRLGWQPTQSQTIPVPVVTATQNRDTPADPMVPKPEAVTSKSAETQTDEDIFDDSIIIPIERYKSKNSHNDSRDPMTGEMRRAIDQIAQLSNGDLVTLFHSCDRETVMTALQGAGEVLQKRCEQVVAPNDLKRYRHLLNRKPQPSPHEAQEAMSRLTEKLQQLAVAGKIARFENTSILVAA